MSLFHLYASKIEGVYRKAMEAKWRFLVFRKPFILLLFV